MYCPESETNCCASRAGYWSAVDALLRVSLSQRGPVPCSESQSVGRDESRVFCIRVGEEFCCLLGRRNNCNDEPARLSILLQTGGSNPEPRTAQDFGREDGHGHGRDGSIARAGEACSGMERCRMWGLEEREPQAERRRAPVLGSHLRVLVGPLTSLSLSDCPLLGKGKLPEVAAEAEEPGPPG